MTNKKTANFIVRYMCVLLMIGTSITPFGCASSGTFRSGVKFDMFGIELWGEIEGSFGPATDLPINAVHIGSVLINGNKVPVYYNPETGEMYFKDTDGDVHKVYISGLPDEIKEKLEGLKRKWEERRNAIVVELPPESLRDTPVTERPDSDLEIALTENELEYLETELAEKISNIALAPVIIPDPAPDPDLPEFDIDFSFNYVSVEDEDWTETSTAVIDVTAIADEIWWDDVDEPDLSRFSIADFDILDNGDGTVTLHAEGSVNSVFAVMMMAHIGWADGTMAGVGEVSVVLNSDYQIASISINEEVVKEVFIHYEN